MLFTYLPLFAVALILAMLARWLFINRTTKLSCPNGHIDELREIKRDTVRTDVFESGKASMGGVGFAQTYIQFAVTYRCYKCGEIWMTTESAG